LLRGKSHPRGEAEFLLRLPTAQCAGGLVGCARSKRLMGATVAE